MFNKEAQRYTATERECLRLKHALENWSWYLLGSKFNVVLYSDIELCKPRLVLYSLYEKVWYRDFY